ncbi:MAG: FAD-dependent oxidoreductase [Anaerolineaceae bacterium]|nr:FAD-dependent oxidoreductase [Anaerolineaceae bacterium]
MSENTHSQEQDDLFPVVVIGAGLAGLAAAVHLAGRGVEPLVLDADSLWPGGRLSGGKPDIIEHEGQEWTFRTEHSVHGVWGGYVNLRATIERFTDTKLQLSYGEDWVNRWGKHVRYMEAGNAVRSKYIPAPFHYLNLLFNPNIWANIAPWDFLSLPGLLLSIMLTVGFDPIAEERTLDGLPMSLFFRGWTPNLRATFTGLAVNLLAAPVEDIDLTGLIAGLRFYTMLRRDAWQLHFFPADSHTSLIQPLIDSIDAHDGYVMGGMTVTRLDRSEGSWQVVATAGTGEVRRFHTRHVIIATDAPGAERLLAASKATANDIDDMIFPRGLRNAVVHLWYKTAPPEGVMGGMLTGDFLPDNFFWLHRLYDDFREWHEATGGSAIELHVYGPKDVLDLPDHNLMAACATDVARAWPNLKGQILHGTVRRNSGVQTRYRVPDARTLAVETPWEGVHACGDWVRYNTPSLWMEHSTTTGIAAANAVLSDLGREPYPVLYPPEPELLARVLGSIVRLGRRVLGKPITTALRAVRRGG